MWKKKNSRRELRKVYRAAEVIQTAETPREADLMTGYVLGVIAEKVESRKLKRRTAQAIGEMVEAIGDGIRKEFIDAEQGNEIFTEPDVVSFDEFVEAAGMDSE